jgi:tetratricopeptide (TPR) repeat protein
MARQTYATAMRVAQQTHLARSVGVHILYKMADIDLQHLDWRAALHVYEQIRTLDPEDVNARSELIDMNFRMGQDTAAITEIDGYIALLENSNRRDRAIDFLKQVVDQRPEKIEARKRLADLYARSQLSDKAVEQLDAVADILLANGNRAAALVIVQSIIALRPPNVKEYMRVLEQLKK